jgi:hypothetical protein
VGRDEEEDSQRRAVVGHDHIDAGRGSPIPVTWRTQPSGAPFVRSISLSYAAASRPSATAPMRRPKSRGRRRSTGVPRGAAGQAPAGPRSSTRRPRRGVGLGARPRLRVRRASARRGRRGRPERGDEGEPGGGRHQYRSPPREGAARALVDALAKRGYEPFEDEAGIIRLANCPFHRLAADHRDLVCGMNQAYVDLEPEPGRCCVAIRPRRGGGSS